MTLFSRIFAGKAPGMMGAALGLALLAGCATSTPPAPVQMANPYPPVPALPVENQGLPPVSEEPLTFQPGHYNWTGTGYAYVPGAWVKRAGHGMLWQAGYWALGPTGWAWVPPHWM